MNYQRTDGRLALLSGGALTALSLGVFWLVPKGESGYLIAPGAVMAALVLGVMRGSPHGGGTTAQVVIFGSAINFCVYSMLSLAGIKLYRGLRKAVGKS